MKKEELLEYEAPWYTEYVFWGWGHTLAGWFLARKINRKWTRYQHRLARKKFIERIKST